MNAKTSSKASAALAQFDVLRATLSATHSEIPALLARERAISRELGLNDSEALRAQLADVTQQRLGAIRRRSSAIAAIMELEPALQGERASVEAQRQAYAAEAVAAFQARYSAAVGALQQLWAEGEALARVLRAQVPMVLPSPVPVRADVAVTVDPAAAQMGAGIDQLDAALALCHAIHQNAAWESRAHVLATNRGTASEHTGTYRVLATFRSQVDGLEFQVGDLVDTSLVSTGMLHRLMTGRRYVVPEAA